MPRPPSLPGSAMRRPKRLRRCAQHACMHARTHACCPCTYTLARSRHARLPPSLQLPHSCGGMAAQPSPPPALLHRRPRAELGPPKCVRRHTQLVTPLLLLLLLLLLLRTVTFHSCWICYTSLRLHLAGRARSVLQVQLGHHHVKLCWISQRSSVRPHRDLQIGSDRVSPPGAAWPPRQAPPAAAEQQQQ